MKPVVLCCLLVICTSALAQSPVEVARVVAVEVNLGQRVVGTVQPLRISTIGSALDGRVIEFGVNNGQAITKGQRLAQLRTGTFEIQLAAARAQLALAKHQLAELANGSLPEDIAEAEANMLAAKAAMENAARKLQRLVALSASQAASEADLEDAQEQADATRFSWMAAEATLKRIKDGPRVELIAQAEARVELQLQQTKLLEDQIERLTIVSPFDGYVAAEFTEVGAWIARGDPIVQIVQLDEVEIQVPATAEHAVNIRRGDTIRVEFPELPDELFVGSVDRIVPVAESRARTFPVYIRMDNRLDDESPMLMAGMLARVELPAGRRDRVPLVPKDALVLNGSDRSVFVIENGSGQSAGDSAGGNSATVRKVPVSLGVAAGGLIQVRGDLKAKDLVVVTGNERLLPGASVNVVRTVESSSPVARSQAKSPSATP